MSKDYIYVPMGDIKCTNNDIHIIGTSSLGPCFGVILYNRDKKAAIVAHSVSDNENLDIEFETLAVLNKIKQNDNDYFEYKIIPGYDKTPNNITSINKLKKSFEDTGYKEMQCFSDVREVMISKNEGYHEFLFDAKTAKFVTSDYSEIVENKNLKTK